MKLIIPVLFAINNISPQNPNNHLHEFTFEFPTRFSPRTLITELIISSQLKEEQ